VLSSGAQRHRRLFELNVVEQVVNVSQTTIVREAWARGQSLTVHGWVYDLDNGLLRDRCWEVPAMRIHSSGRSCPGSESAPTSQKNRGNGRKLR
jgi:hypothetical protein